MAESSGISSSLGAPLTDWEHVQQSVRKILTTPLGSRVMRRDFGSELFDLVDRKMTARAVLAVYAAAAMAISRWEPRFRLTEAALVEAAPNGRVTFALFGSYYPRGHLGDFSEVVSPRRVEIVIGAQS